MARDHARLLVSIWSDEEFVTLKVAQQMTYLSLISSPDLSWCGVAPLLPQRTARLAADLTEAKVRAALDELQGRRFLVIDDATAEIAVRSYVRHDGILKQPNVTKAMVKALLRIHSDDVAGVIRDELARELRENPDAKGWPSVRSEQPELFAELQEKASQNPSPDPLRKVG